MIVSRAARATIFVAMAALAGCAGRDARREPHGVHASAGAERIGLAAGADELVATRTEEPASADATAPEAARRAHRADEPEGADVLDARALANLAEGRLALAEDAANRALAADAHYAPSHNTLGLVHVRRGELDLARAVAPRGALSGRETATDGVDRPDAGGGLDAGRDGAHPGAGRRATGAFRACGDAMMPREDHD